MGVLSSSFPWVTFVLRVRRIRYPCCFPDLGAHLHTGRLGYPHHRRRCILEELTSHQKDRDGWTRESGGEEGERERESEDKVLLK